jgi:hypothetical protein
MLANSFDLAEAQPSIFANKYVFYFVVNIMHVHLQNKWRAIFAYNARIV